MQTDDFSVTRLPIRLGQFLKLAAIADDGLHAKRLIANGEILVNNVTVKNRGKQLFEGDIIEYLGKFQYCLSAQ